MSWAERLTAIFDNPLIVKDAVSRMRSWRAPVILTVYLGLLGGFGYTIFVLATIAAPVERSGSAQIGALVFSSLGLIQMSLVSLFAPALASGAISGERERQTFDVLLVSRISAAGIVWGKLVASVAFMLLLILAALPLFAAVFLFGGIDFEQFLVTQVLTVSTAVSISAVSLLLSSVFRRTLPSTVVAYGVAFFGMVGTLVAGVLLSIAIAVRTVSGLGAGGADVHPLLFVNPFYAMSAVLNNPTGASMHVGRLAQLAFIAGGPASDAGPSLEPWQAAVLFQAVLVGLCVFGAVQLVHGRRAPVPARELEEPARPLEAGSQA